MAIIGVASVMVGVASVKVGVALAKVGVAMRERGGGWPLLFLLSFSQVTSSAFYAYSTTLPPQHYEHIFDNSASIVTRRG